MSAVERVVYRDATGRRRTVLITDVRNLTVFGSLPAIRGVEVDRDGVIKDPPKAYLDAHGAEAGRIVHIIMTEMIESRTAMRQDLTYGGLVPA